MHMERDVRSSSAISDLSCLSSIARHGHVRPYATIILSGGYEEAGDGGRFRVEAGDVLIHPPFSAHCDRDIRAPARLLDLPLPMDGRDWARRGWLADPDNIVRTAELDLTAAASLLLERFQPRPSAEADLPDCLAAALDRPRPPAIADWACAHGLARETVSRAFTRLYEVAPARYRVEARARRAWRMIVADPGLPLSDIAYTCGYADQAQLTREVRALTGHPPGAWRRRAASASHSFKTGQSAPR